MKIDLFTHFFPKRFAEEFVKQAWSAGTSANACRMSQPSPTWTRRFRVMDEFGDYCQVLSLPAPPLEVIAGPEKSPLLDESPTTIGRLVAKYPDRFIAFIASLPLNNPDESMKEMDRAVHSSRAGIMIYPTSPVSRWTSRILPLFEEAARPIFLLIHRAVRQLLGL